MTYQQPTEILGHSINAWDMFYSRHFDWTYRQTLELCHNTLIAKALTDKIFAKISLSNPEHIVSQDRAAILKELGILFPYLGSVVSKDKELSAGRLLHLYYQPN